MLSSVIASAVTYNSTTYLSDGEALCFKVRPNVQYLFKVNSSGYNVTIRNSYKVNATFYKANGNFIGRLNKYQLNNSISFGGYAGYIVVNASKKAKITLVANQNNTVSTEPFLYFNSSYQNFQKRHHFDIKLDFIAYGAGFAFFLFTLIAFCCCVKCCHKAKAKKLNDNAIPLVHEGSEEPCPSVAAENVIPPVNNYPAAPIYAYPSQMMYPQPQFVGYPPMQPRPFVSYPTAAQAEAVRHLTSK